jgi:hypothetical protein
MAGRELVDACFMWCMHKRLVPRAMDESTAALVKMAVLEYKGKFSDLNDRQREVIAAVKF